MEDVVTDAQTGTVIREFISPHFQNGNYYGVKKIKGDLVKVPLDKTKLNKIKVKDDTKSTIMTIALPVVIIAPGLGVFAHYWYGGIWNEYGFSK